MTSMTLSDWQTKAAAMTIEGRAFINGQYAQALSGETRPTINPATGKVLTDVASCGQEDADLAIAGARKAFESGVWSKMAPA
ncbi:MAG: aldehyde dehydrogenase family protein, partial [Planctomycetes bacterium]|nr:aldehyde dehydrogenase family protein [Planctomycetota bacterium]